MKSQSRSRVQPTTGRARQPFIPLISLVVTCIMFVWLYHAGMNTVPFWVLGATVFTIGCMIEYLVELSHACETYGHGSNIPDSYDHSDTPADSMSWPNRAWKAITDFFNSPPDASDDIYDDQSLNDSPTWQEKGAKAINDVFHPSSADPEEEAKASPSEHQGDYPTWKDKASKAINDAFNPSSVDPQEEGKNSIIPDDNSEHPANCPMWPKKASKAISLHLPTVDTKEEGKASPSEHQGDTPTSKHPASCPMWPKKSSKANNDVFNPSSVDPQEVGKNGVIPNDHSEHPANCPMWPKKSSKAIKDVFNPSSVDPQDVGKNGIIPDNHSEHQANSPSWKDKASKAISNVFHPSSVDSQEVGKNSVIPENHSEHQGNCPMWPKKASKAISDALRLPTVDPKQEGKYNAIPDDHSEHQASCPMWSKKASKAISDGLHLPTADTKEEGKASPSEHEGDTPTSKHPASGPMWPKKASKAISDVFQPSTVDPKEDGMGTGGPLSSQKHPDIGSQPESGYPTGSQTSKGSRPQGIPSLEPRSRNETESSPDSPSHQQLSSGSELGQPITGSRKSQPGYGDRLNNSDRDTVDLASHPDLDPMQDSEEDPDFSPKFHSHKSPQCSLTFPERALNKIINWFSGEKTQDKTMFDASPSTRARTTQGVRSAELNKIYCDPTDNKKWRVVERRITKTDLDVGQFGIDGHRTVVMENYEAPCSDWSSAEECGVEVNILIIPSLPDNLNLRSHNLIFALGFHHCLHFGHHGSFDSLLGPDLGRTGIF